MRLEGLDKLKKIHLVGTRTLSLSVCSVVAQPTMLSHAPSWSGTIIMITQLIYWYDCLLYWVLQRFLLTQWKCDTVASKHVWMAIFGSIICFLSPKYVFTIIHWLAHYSKLHLVGWYSDNAPDLCSRGVQFDSRSGHWLTSARPGKYWDSISIRPSSISCKSFQIHRLLISHLLRLYSPDTGSVIK
jgi:hypothetical protein